MHSILQNIAWVLGLTNPSGSFYLFWSGIFGDAALFGGGIVIYRHHLCHARGCFRLSRHKVEGTAYITCRHHHPELTGTTRASAEHIATQAIRHLAAKHRTENDS